MKRSILYFWCFFVFLSSGMTLHAQNNTSFPEKWKASQKKADGIAFEYTSKYPEVKHYKTVYKHFHDSISNEEILLDMFIEIPDGDGPFPVVVFVHGGGFITGDKSNFTPQTFALALNGVVGISIEYRLKGHGGNYASYIADVTDAIDFVRKNSKNYKIDFSNMGLAGGSAGAYLSSLAAMRTPECTCYIGYNGVYDISGKSLPGVADETRDTFSPILQIKTPPPATLLLHGKEDTTVDHQQSILFAKSIREKGGNAEVILYDGQKHGFFNKEPYLTQTTDALVKHVLKVFKLVGREK